MFAKKIDLFSIMGFRVSFDLTWFILAALIVWSLATAYFPYAVEGIDPVTSLRLGVAGAVGLFVSIILHELSHAIVARKFDIPIAGITLFIFGGVAEMEREPPSAQSEFFMAIAGPIASYVLAAVFHIVALSLPEATAANPFAALFSYLALINTILATFNLIPAFPLDGGRVFRAALWWYTGNLAKATRYSAIMGRFFGTFLILLGVLSVISGNFVAGMWQGLIGLFITGAAGSSEMQMTLKSVLKDARVADVMTAPPVYVPATLPLDRVIEDYFYRYNHKVFPVVRDGLFSGCVTLEDVGKIAPGDRPLWTAGEIVSGGDTAPTITPETGVMEALTTMNNSRTSRLMVVRNAELRGVITMRDIMVYVAIHGELEGTIT